ncbi:MAG: antirestriction protein ArdA, partial [Hyphomonas sp.]
MTHTPLSSPRAAGAAPTPAPRPRIYVACLAAYNNGCLHGRWIAVTTPDEIMSEVRAMLADSPLPDAEEWAIHGATRKSHLLSEAGMPLVEPSRPFLAGACELGNRLVRSLRKRAGSWQP